LVAKIKKIITSTIAVVLVCSVTGIGLSIAKGIVQNHKGKINAFSDDGKSLRITVEF